MECSKIFFKKWKKTVPNIIFHEGLPLKEELHELTQNYKHNIVILDDLMHEVVKNSDVELFFARGSHHKKLSVMYLNQNMFCQRRIVKNISLNSRYLIRFKNLRESLQIQKLGQQLYSGKGEALIEAYKDCMETPFGYLVIDLSSRMEEKYRLRSFIFPEEDTIIYKPKRR